MWFRLSRVASVTSQETSFLAMHEATVISLTEKYSKLASECTWIVVVRQHGIPVVRSNRKRKWFDRSFYSHLFLANHSHSSETDTGFELPASNYLRETPSAETRVYRLPSNYSHSRQTDHGFEFPISQHLQEHPFRWNLGVSVPSNHSGPMKPDLGFEFPTSNYPLGTLFRWNSGVSVA